MEEMIKVGDFMNSNIMDNKILNLCLNPKDIMKFWDRCGLVSNFSSNYLFIYSQNQKQKNICNSLSVILNELIENAVKYSTDKDSLIYLDLYNLKGFIIVEIANYVSKDKADNFKQIAGTLSDKEKVNSNYLDLICKNSSEDQISGIGLATLINYFNVDFSFKFNGPDQSNLYKISIQTKINIEELGI